MLFDNPVYDRIAGVVLLVAGAIIAACTLL
jgi:uncharacterized membrane protein